MQTDKIFYSLFQAFPSIFFAIIGDTTANVNAYQFVSVELKETAFRIDGVFIPTSETTNQPLNQSIFGVLLSSIRNEV